MSFRFNSVFAVLLFSGFTFFACVPETPITNPYDPELPADQQQEGLLTGLVKGAQPGSDNAILLEGATLDLKGDFTPVNNPISTPSDGSFNFGELMPGVYSLEIKHPAHFRQVRELSFTAGQHRNLEIILDAIPSTGNTETSSHLTGIIHKAGELNLDVSQQDHSGITVEITGAGIRTTTNQQGRFDLYLASGDYEVDLSAPNYVSQNGIALSTRTGETTELSNSPIVLQSNPGQIKGNAFLETAAENTHDAIDVVLLGSDSAGQTQADGSFLLTGVEAGTYTLQASKTDYDTTTVPGVSVRGGLLSTVADFTLYRSRGGIRGQVGTSIAETDLSGILISLSGTNISTTTNASGLFLIENIPTGSYQFTARLNGFQDASSEVFTVLANENIEVPSLLLESNPGSVTGIVWIEGGGTTGNAGIEVRLSDSGLSDTTSADGSFSIPGVLADTYTLQASRDNHDTESVLGVLVRPGANTTVPSFKLSRSRGNISGTVELQGSNIADHSGVTLMLTGTSYVATTNSGGDFGFENIPTGIYELVASKDEFSTESRDSITVSANAETVITPVITLVKQQGSFHLDAGHTYTNHPTGLVGLTMAAPDDTVEFKLSGDLMDTDISGIVTIDDWCPTGLNSDANDWCDFDSMTAYEVELKNEADGVKSISVVYRNATQIESSQYADGIILDRAPPTIIPGEDEALLINGGATHTKSSTISLFFAMEDTLSDVKQMQITIEVDGGGNPDFSNALPQDYLIIAPADLDPLATGTEGLKTVYIIFTDGAGNTTAVPYDASITYDYTPPSFDVTPTLECVSSSAQSGFCDEHTVVLTMVISDNFSATENIQTALTNSLNFPTNVDHQTFESPLLWNLSPGDGDKEVKIQLIDEAANVANGTAQTIRIDTQAPSLSLTLGIGPYTQTTTDIALTVTGESTAKLILSGSLESAAGTYAGGAWPTTVDLSNSDGIKTVSAILQDEAGNLSAEANTSIIYDQTPPESASVLINAGTTYLTGGSEYVTLSISGSDLLSGISQMCLTNDGNCDTENWVGFNQNPAAHALSSGEGLKTVTIFLKDGAGNAHITGEGASDSIIWDNTPPEASSILINTGDTHTNNPNISLAIAVAADESGIKSMAIEQGTSACGGRAYIDFESTADFTLTNIVSDGEKTVSVCIKDGAENTSLAYVSDTIFFDQNIPSDGSISINNGDLYTNSLNVSTTIDTGTADINTPIVTMAVQNAEITSCAGLQFIAFSSSANVELPSIDGVSTVSVCLQDKAGNTTLYTDTIIVDRTRPQTPVVHFNAGSLTNQEDGQVVTITSEDAIKVTITGATSGFIDTDLTDDSFTGPTETRSINLTDGDGDKIITITTTDRAGNQSYPTTANIVLDETGPTASDVVLKDNTTHQQANYTNTSNVIVEITSPDDSNGVPRMAIADGIELCNSLTYGIFLSSSIFDMGSGDGLRNITVCLKDGAENTSRWVPQITLDTVKPTASGVVIDGATLPGPTYTKDLEVSINILSAADNNSLSHMSVTPGTSINCDTASYETYAPSKTINLPNEEGTATVTLCLKDAAGNTASFSDSIILDSEAPPPPVVTFVDGGKTNAQDSTEITIVSAGSANMDITGDIEAPVSTNYNSTFTIDLEDTEGVKNISVVTTDAAGNTSTTGTASIELDLSGPTSGTLLITGSKYKGASSTQVTGTESVVVEASATDAIEMQFANNATFSGAVWLPYSTDPISWQLLPGDSTSKAVWARFKDDTGNLSATVSDTIDLDTTAPNAGTLVLQGGASITSSNPADVAITVDATAGTNWTLVLSGNIGVSDAGEYTTTTIGTVSLTGGEGENTVIAILYDEAGNPSVPYSDSIVLDQSVPVAGTVTLADGDALVYEQIIPITITDTDPATAPDSMVFWSSSNTGCGSTPTCGTSGFVPFAPTHSLTLVAGTGIKDVCWMFCDEAGNATSVETQELELRDGRPTPVLTSLSDLSLVALSNESASGGDYSLTLYGSSISSDSLAEVGDFQLPCDTAAQGTNCQPGPTNCATECTISLPNAIMRNVGTYVVKLYTPDPVQNGINTSTETKFFSVIAPLPDITKIHPRGVSQYVANGEPIDYETTYGVPLRIKIWGSNLMDNVQFKLGDNFGIVDVFIPDPEKPTDYLARYAEVLFSTAGLAPSDLNDFDITAINPSPGGGEDALPFGINPEFTLCQNNENCSSNLRWTKTEHISESSVSQTYAYETARERNTQWMGGTHVEIRSQSGELLTRLNAKSSGHHIPRLSSSGGLEQLTISDARGTQPVVSLVPIRYAGDGTFDDGDLLSKTAGTGPMDMASADLNLDGIADAVVVNSNAYSVSVFWGTLTNGCSTDADCAGNQCRSNQCTGFLPQVSYPMGAYIERIRLADLNGDGYIDILTSYSSVTSIRLNQGDETFGDINQLPHGNINAVADINNDGSVDILLESRIYFGRGDGNFENPITIAQGELLVDMDLDGNLDIVASATGSFEIELGNGDGTFQSAQTYSANVCDAYYLASADLNSNGFEDIIWICKEKMYVYLSDGNGGFLSGVEYAGALTQWSSSVATNDVNDDGFVDILILPNKVDLADDHGHLRIYINDGTGSFPLPDTYYPDISHFARGATLLDLNLDGALDLAYVHWDSGSIEVAYGNQGAVLGGYDLLPITEDNPRDIRLGDTDLDGYADIYIMDQSQSNSVYWGKGEGEFETENVLGSSAAKSIEVADFDGDGYPDYAMSGSYYKALYLYYGDGDGGFTKDATNYSGAQQIEILRVGDLDNNGAPDLVASFSNTTDDGAIVFLNAPGGCVSGSCFSAPTTYNLGEATMPTGMVLSDLDNDGYLDIILRNSTKTGCGDTCATYSVLMNDGDGTFGAPTTFDLIGSIINYSFLGGIDSGDVDQDGFNDIVLSQGGDISSGANTEAVLLLGNGDGTFFAPVSLTSGTHYYDLQLQDYNGDSYLDIILSGEDSLNPILVLIGDGTGSFTKFARFDAGDRPGPNDIGTLFSGGGLTVANINNLGHDISLNRLSPPSAWAQELRDMPEMTVAAPNGGASTSLTIHQVAQYADKIHARVRLSGGGDYTGTTLTLTSPSGDSVVLDNNAGAWPSDQPWVHSYEITSSLILNSWQPEGDWQVEVTNASLQTLQIEDFAIIAHGWFHRWAAGTDPENPEKLFFASGTTSKSIYSSTLGHRDLMDLSCSPEASSGVGPGERYFEYTVDNSLANTMRIEVVADFNAIAGIYRGSCDNLTEIACNNDSVEAYGFNPRIPSAGGSVWQTIAAPANDTFCIVVDGVYDSSSSPETIHNGDFWMRLTYGSAPNP